MIWDVFHLLFIIQQQVAYTHTNTHTSPLIIFSVFVSLSITAVFFPPSRSITMMDDQLNNNNLCGGRRRKKTKSEKEWKFFFGFFPKNFFLFITDLWCYFFTHLSIWAIGSSNSDIWTLFFLSIDCLPTKLAYAKYKGEKARETNATSHQQVCVCVCLYCENNFIKYLIL